MAAGCARGEGAWESADVIAHPHGDAVVFEVTTVGGEPPRDRFFTDVPSLTVYGSGRLIAAAPQPALFPPPTLPTLVERRLSEEGVQQLLRAGEAMGLLGDDVDYGRPTVGDGVTTVVTVHAAGRIRTYEVPGLGGSAGEAGLTAQQERVRRRLRDFLAALATAVTTVVGPEEVSAAKPFKPEAFAIRTEVVAQESSAVASSELSPQVVPWPLDDVDPGTASDCQVVRGSPAERLAEAVGGTTMLTRFRRDELSYSLEVRPLLPSEEGCEAVTPPH